MVADETARRDQLRAKVPLMNEELVEEDLSEEQYQCCTCKGFCYLSQVICSCTKLVACVEHADTLCACPPARRALRKRYSEAQLEEILEIVSNRASLPENWRARFDNLLEVPRPPLKSMRALLNDGEKIAHPMPEIHDLRAVVNRANDWVERVTTLLTRKGAGRKKRKQTGHDEDGGDRNPDTLQALLREAERLAFDSPEILTLRQMLLSIESFKSEAASIMGAADSDLDLEKCRTTLILGNSLNIEMPELATIQTTVNRLEWFIKLDEEVDDRTLQYEEVVSLLEEADECDVPVDHPSVVELRKREAAGREWKDAVEDLLRSDSIEIPQITELIEGKELIPTSIATMRELEALRRQALTWQSTASAQFGGHGSSFAAARLVKAVRTAKGPLSKINVPELAELQAELDFHDRWRQELAAALHVETKEVTKIVNNLLAVFEQHFHPEDNLPTPGIVCFCRTPPGPTMVQCSICLGDYHPKCVGVASKNLDKLFTCAMCSQGSPDDRPSLDSVSHFSTTDRQRFRIVPAEVDILTKVTDIAIENAQHLVGIVDPLRSAVVCRDFELLAHWHRKLFNLPVTFDARNTITKERVVFEEWLYKRMMDAKHPVKQTKTRPRKPKLVLRQAREGQFSCICSVPPADALVTVSCVKCRQGYHASCVRAPAECLGAEGKNWRCPCCTVKEAKRLQQGDVAVRVQNSGDSFFPGVDLVTDEQID
jgi:histone demethylase JARID1